jgi:hypothetical protein
MIAKHFVVGLTTIAILAFAAAGQALAPLISQLHGLLPSPQW